MYWAGKKVLVTGGGGFIGSHLVEELITKCADVTAMLHYNSRGDRGNLDFIPAGQKAKLDVVAGNIEDSDFVSNCVAGREVLFHLAALIGIPYSYEAPRSYIQTNVVGTLNVLEAARRYGVKRVVHTSTSETYGTAIYTPIDEEHPLQAQSPYSASKIGADKVAESYYLSFGLPVTTIRPFNTYGPRQSARAVIPTIIIQALTKDAISLGSLTPVRDLNYVKDTVLGFIKTAESEATIGQTVNVGSGKGITIGDLAARILHLMKCSKPILLDDERVRPPNSEVFELICDNRKARELIGWHPLYTLDKGLTATIEFISENLNLYRPEIYAR